MVTRDQHAATIAHPWSWSPPSGSLKVSFFIAAFASNLVCNYWVATSKLYKAIANMGEVLEEKGVPAAHELGGVSVYVLLAPSSTARIVP